jgi:ElaB/YqjD/DUF883 family membrane-anchored ribosome-binding protein
MNTPVTNLQAAKAQVRDKLSEDLAQAIDDAEELIRLTAEQTGERVAAVRDRAKASLARARMELGRVHADAAERAKRAASSVDDYVHANPWKALGVVGVLGMVVGALIARR